MATASKKARPTKAGGKAKPTQPAAPKGARPRPRSEPSSPPNFLINASNGLFLQSGATGELRKLTDDEVSAIGKVLSKRQKLGLKLAQLLTDRGFTLSPSEIFDGPSGP
jgi:hypothetical protein